MTFAEYFGILSVVATVAGATWALRTKLGDIEVALKAHVVSTAHEIEKVTGRVIRLESRRRK